MGDGCLSALDGRADSGPAKEAVAICIRRSFCGGGIGIIAEIDCAEQAVPKAIGMKQTPDCRLQSMQNIAVALDFIFGQGEKFIEVA